MSLTPSVHPSAPPAGTSSPPRQRRGWTAPRIASVVGGSIAGLLSLTLLSFGGLATYETNADRDATGYVNADTNTITTGGYVITSNEFAELADRVYADAVGDVRLRATSTDGSAVFIGVAPTTAVDQYLKGVDRTVVTGWFGFETEPLAAAGTAPSTTPAGTKIWTHQVSGTGTQSLAWDPQGDTTVVIMNADASRGVSVTADIGATLPGLVWVAVVLFILGALFLAAAVGLIAVPLARIGRESRS